MHIPKVVLIAWHIFALLAIFPALSKPISRTAGSKNFCFNWNIGLYLFQNQCDLKPMAVYI